MRIFLKKLEAVRITRSLKKIELILLLCY